MRPGTTLACLGVCALIAGCGGDDDGGGGGSADEIKIGALYPLSGQNASAGLDTLNGVRLAAEVINQSKPDLDLPLAEGEGLPNMDGAKIKLVSGDTAGTPEKGASEVDRLVTSEKVVTVVGAYQSAVTLTASERAERLQVPFLNAESSAPGLTERGLKWFFRTGPTDRTFGEAMFGLLDAQKEQGRDTDRIAVIHTNDEYGTDGAEVTREIAEAGGREIVADVKYEPTTTDLTPQVQQVRAAKPDAVFVLSYTNDAVLLVKTMKRLGYEPPAVLAYGAGFADPAFLEGVGSDADGMMSRASWSLELAEKKPTTKAIAEMFEARFRRPMSENSARGFTGMLALAQAIDEAGSTEPQKIADALRNLDVPGERTIMPWQGIKFDAKQQNAEAAGVVEQLVGGEYRVVFPPDVAGREATWPLSAAQD